MLAITSDAMVTKCTLLQHFCIDGSIPVTFSSYFTFWFLEQPEPDWSCRPKHSDVAEELNFDVDDHIIAEITKVTINAGKNVCSKISKVLK